MVGHIPHRELYLWYSAGDCFCLVSKNEGCPNVVLESLACGTPVVATRVGGIPEIIRSGEFGFMTAASEIEIANNILKVLEYDWDWEKIHRFSRNNSWNRVGNSIINLFESTLFRENHEVFPVKSE